MQVAVKRKRFHKDTGTINCARMNVKFARAHPRRKGAEQMLACSQDFLSGSRDLARDSQTLAGGAENCMSGSEMGAGGLRSRVSPLPTAPLPL
jgi:hypothetical protein